MRRRRAPEIIAGRVAGDGSIIAGDGFTVVRQSLGTYVLTFAPGFKLISVTANPALNGAWTIYEYVWTPNSVTLGIFVTSTGAVADVPFAFTATGVQQ